MESTYLSAIPVCSFDSKELLLKLYVFAADSEVWTMYSMATASLENDRKVVCTPPRGIGLVLSLRPLRHCQALARGLAQTVQAYFCL
jgi:hypothetical protein